MLHHKELTKPIIELASKCIGAPVRDYWNRFTPPRYAGNWNEPAFGYSTKLEFRRCTKADLCPLDSGLISRWKKSLSWKSKRCRRVHDMQLQTYLRMSGLPVGLPFNSHAPRLKDGLRRFIG